MGTRAILAVREGESGWKGVLQAYDGGLELAHYLMAQVREYGGDIARLVAEIVSNAPGGWYDVRSRERRGPDHLGDDPPFYDPETFEDADPAYIYVFDVAARRLLVLDPSEDDDVQATRPAHVVEFSDTGEPSPRELRERGPRCAHAAVVALNADVGPGGPQRKLARFRELLASRTRPAGPFGWLRRAPSEEALRDAAHTALAARLTELYPGDDARRAVVEHEICREEDEHWDLALPEGWTLRVPTQTAYRPSFQDGQVVWTPSGGWCRLRGGVALLTPGFERVFGGRGAELAAGVVAAAASAAVDGDCIVRGDQLLHRCTVVDGAVGDNERHVSTARETIPSARVGERHLFPHTFNLWTWTVYDWLAMPARPSPALNA